MTGAGAAVGHTLLSLGLGQTHTTVIGASGAIYGVLVAFGMLFPEARILFLFLFPIPARVFVWIMAAIVMLNALGAPGGHVSNVAHLGGMLAGYVILVIAGGGLFSLDTVAFSGSSRSRIQKPD